jgi:hypothetical protein
MRKKYLLFNLMILFAFLAFCNEIAAQSFTEITNTNLPALGQGSVAVGDINNDGKLDIVMSGQVTATSDTTRVFFGKGDGTFTESAFNNGTGTGGAINIPGMEQTSVALGDYDNDGNLDLLITGVRFSQTSKLSTTKLYHNTGAPNYQFVENPTSSSFIQVHQADARFFDYNNDGRLDIILSGCTENSTSGQSGSRPKGAGIYKNNGDGIFSLISSSLIGSQYSCNIPGDYNNDGYMDILQIGYPGLDKLFKNNGDGTFSDLGRNGTLPSQKNDNGIAAVLVDYNNDGLLEPNYWAGQTSTGFTILPVNSSTFAFITAATIAWSPATPTSLTQVSNSRSIAWADYDNDGIQDLILTSKTGPTSTLYRQAPIGTFTAISDFTLPGVRWGNVIWGDFDGDNKLDILITGCTNTTDTYTGTTKIFSNKTTMVRTANLPKVPDGLAAVAGNNKFTLTWNKTTDDAGGVTETPQLGLTYDLRVGTTPGGIDAKAPASSVPSVSTDPSYAKIPSPGYIRGTIAGTTVTYPMANLAGGATYYFSVQAVDYTLQRSGWSTEQSVYIPSLTPTTQATNVTASNIQATLTKITVTKGSGYKRAIFIAQASSGQPTVTDGQTYIGNSEFGKGSEAGTGWFCVCNGVVDTVTITGLTAKLGYMVYVYEYDGYSGTEKYNTTTATGNPGQFATKVSQFLTIVMDQKTYLDPPSKLGYTLTTSDGTAGSGNPVVFTSLTPLIGKVSGTTSDTLTILSGGQLILQATIASNTDYSAGSIIDTFTINRHSQYITYDVIVPTKTYGDAPFDISGAVASTGLPVTYTTTDTMVAKVSGTTATILKSGTISIVSLQAGNQNYLPTKTYTPLFNIVKAKQSILSFDSIPDKKIGDDDFPLVATSNSDVKVYFDSDNTPVVSLYGVTGQGDYGHIISPGQVTITAYLQEDERYLDGGTISRTFNVSSTTGIDELTAGKEWLVYPNPAQETVTVALASLLPPTTLTIYSRTGQAVYTTVLDNTSNDISLSNLAPGFYVIKVVTPKKILVKQLIKQ